MLSALCGVIFISVIYFILLLFKLVGADCLSKTVEWKLGVGRREQQAIVAAVFVGFFPNPGLHG